MKTNVEKQVAAFDQVLGHCNALGPMYNPNKETMKVTALTSLLTSAQASIQAVDTAKTNLILAINDRQKVFAPLPGTATRILNALVATDASPQLIADVRLYRDKIRGSNASTAAKAKPEDSTTGQPNPADSSRGPLSQRDYDTKIRNFGTLILLLKSETSYEPNETDITLTALTNVLASLKEAHKAVSDAQVVLRNARSVRRSAVYGDSGIYGAGKRVKRYILSVFGANSDEFRKVNSISITAG